jgi:hypothetical protein
MALWQMDIVGGVYVSSPRSGEPVEAKVVTGVEGCRNDVLAKCSSDLKSRVRRRASEISGGGVVLTCGGDWCRSCRKGCKEGAEKSNGVNKVAPPVG